ncbi:hypothetical protein COC42_06830 [Sphingomonas spermidinifaciens]|uniref:Uncharacterized protein n=1 Tax=Sphingomonas spermidinifaciens TaxID=1141889 RepID=A0A2A4B8A4_9SPHN|nr:hypothetical protein [Sphingomonas spermidinifaciens]PCD04019.1 hypothetical protein COC42_06830 [Sphingomonas spermidinifaciens]
MKKAAIVGTMVAYWVATAIIAIIAIGAPCGLAPDERCDLEGPSMFGRLLLIGPIGVLAASAVAFTLLTFLFRRMTKGR